LICGGHMLLNSRDFQLGRHARASSVPDYYEIKD
jgi:hypothetical protein